MSIAINVWLRRSSIVTLSLHIFMIGKGLVEEDCANWSWFYRLVGFVQMLRGCRG